MTEPNLRHLRLFVATVESGSVTQAAKALNVTQSAATQALKRIEDDFARRLFDRTSRGIFPTAEAERLAARARRALVFLDRASERAAPRLRLTATSAQLTALVAAAEAESLSLGARRLGITQPTVHRAIAQLEREVGRALFRRTPYGSTPTRIGSLLSQAAQLAFAELRQARMELAEAGSQSELRITIGAMPLSRASILPEAIARFQEHHQTVGIRIHEGPYASLLAGLRRGEIDLLLGALRPSVPEGDIVQERLFDDDLAIVCGPRHPLARESRIDPAALAAARWVVALPETPARRQFDAFLQTMATGASGPFVETGSQMLLRELLNAGPYLGCISRLQISGEIASGSLVRLPFALPESRRPIGMTMRADWQPTRIQAALMNTVREVAARLAG